MKKILILSIILFLFSTAVFAEGIVHQDDGYSSAPIQQQKPAAYQPQEPAYQPAQPSRSSTQRIAVQKVARLRALTSYETNAIEVYMSKFGCPKQMPNEMNRRSLRAALCFLISIDQSHVPLTRKPYEYMADYQTYTQLLERTDFYANVPVNECPPPICLPEFVPGEELGQLVLDEVPVCPPPAQKAERPCQPAGAFSFSSDRERHEQTVGGAYWSQEDQRVKEQKTCPPKSETCGPGTAPTPPSPNSPAVSGIHDPSGQIPNPPLADVHQPSPANPGGHGTGGNTWDPKPTNPHIADPVN